ncbi:MAG: filamentous hemagglutinin N-terminal domain-containing protein [Scytonematopsis contorta HA4267-MV1]|jgi:filamentous hemagglutinin family protein|nr:filamentous hemagglutinin N-terminal domain-containing protein [Scytonematopsis contorta HA4267-MV1]
MKLEFFQALGITIGSTIIFTSNCVLAQITPDATLRNNSQVRLQDNIRFIEGGTQAGSNLFHSFKEFSVPTNSTAHFNNARDVQNILTRVTGGSISNIDGLIRANHNANLFLINPSGIIFGQNARLNIGGSFVGTTANAIGFGNLGNFSATNPEAPSPLLTINPNALLFNQIKGGRIESNSIAPDGRNPSNNFDINGLRVVDGKSLLLVGGDVNINALGADSGGGLYAFGGRVELGGLAGIGTVGLNVDGDNFSLSFPSDVQRSDVFLSNNARVNVRAGNGGSITINAHDLQMTLGSQILAGIESGLGSETSIAGNIDINATGRINLQQGSKIFNYVGANALGQGGDINIRTNTLRLTEGSQISTSTLGVGQGGDLRIDATSSVELIGRNTVNSRFPSGLFTQQSTSGESGKGNAGNLIINTPLLRVLDGATISAITFGAGRGGDLSIDTGNGRVEVIGTSRSGSESSINAEAESTATGAAGNLIIKTDQLIVQNGGQISAGTSGAGQGGNLTVTATRSVELTGKNTVDSNFPSGLFAQQETKGATGSAGNLTINTPLLQVLQGANVSASTRGAGRGGDVNINTGTGIIEVIGTSRSVFDSRISADSIAKGAAGNLTINTGELIARDGGQISANTYGTGQGGNLTVTATRSIELNGDFPTGLFAQQNISGATGNAGNLTINTPLLQVLQGAIVSASTGGAGRGGDVNINTGTGRIEVIGTSNSLFGTRISADSTAKRAAGNLTINTGELIARDGGVVSAATSGAGQGGNLTVTATRSVELTGQNANNNPSGLFTQQNTENATGNAGNLSINTDQLLVRDGATIAVRSLGTGTAGNLTISTKNSINLDNALLTANTRSNGVDQAIININSADLILRRGSEITTDASGFDVTGGNININTNNLALLERSKITANSTDARGGKININTQGLFQSLDSRITARGATQELSGTVNITTLVDPSRGVAELPQYLINAAALINQHFCARAYKSSFTITGRGGIAPSPYDVFAGETTWEDWRMNPISQGRGEGQKVTSVMDEKKVTTTTQKEVVEAQGWVVNKKGQVELVATTQNVTPHRLQSVPVECLINTAN